MFRIIIISLSLFSFCHSYGQEKNSYPEFYGKWINMHFETTLTNSPTNKGIANITPQYIFIDTFGNLTIYSRFEQKSFVGKPYKLKLYGKLKQLVYKHWGELYITQVSDSVNLVAITSLNNGMGVLFRKIE